MKYKFEWNDIRALIAIVNAYIVFTYGLSVGWLALTMAAFGLVNDVTTNKRINGFIIHSFGVLISIYFLKCA